MMLRAVTRAVGGRVQGQVRRVSTPVLSGRVAAAAGPQSEALQRWGCSARALSGAVDKVKVTYIDGSGDSETVDATIGDSLLDIAHDNDIEIEGACGGEMACSTCHVILEKKVFDMLPEAEEEEEDMLDLALGLTETSRLGCQVCVTKEMAGTTVRLPSEVANMQG